MVRASAKTPRPMRWPAFEAEIDPHAAWLLGTTSHCIARTPSEDRAVNNLTPKVPSKWVPSGDEAHVVITQFGQSSAARVYDRGVGPDFAG
jgi:hypothetical protein